MENGIIALVSPEPIVGEGGLGWSQKRIGSILAEHGYEVHIICLSPFIDDSLDKNKTITEVPSWHDNIRCFDITPFYSYSEKDFAWMEIIKGMEELIVDYNYKILHGMHISYTGFPLVYLGKKYGIKTILSGRGSDINKNIYSQGFLSKTLWAIEFADMLTFVSQEMLEKANILYPCKNKSTVIYNTTSRDFFIFEDTGTKKSENKKGIIIGGSGTLDNKKGVSTLVFLMNKMVSAMIDFKIKWIGCLGKKSEIRHIEQLMIYKEMGLIDFTGWIPHNHVLNELHKLDIYLSLSPDEGCPNALLEAMLAKVPIISTTVGAIPEIFENDVDAILIPPYDYEKAYQAITKLNSNYELGEFLAQNSYKKVIANFNLSREREEWIQLYDKVFDDL